MESEFSIPNSKDECQMHCGRLKNVDFSKKKQVGLFNYLEKKNKLASFMKT